MATESKSAGGEVITMGAVMTPLPKTEDMDAALVDYLTPLGTDRLLNLFRACAHPTWLEVLDAHDLEAALYVAQSIRTQALALKDDLIVLPKGPATAIFNAFAVPFPPPVVILGQNPYPSASHAHGYSFSAQDGTVTASLSQVAKAHPSLDLGTGNLTSWVRQGVFLFNASLTTMNNVASARLTHGAAWKHFSTLILAALLKCHTSIAFLVWGRDAKDVFLDARSVAGSTPQHHVTMAPHPSPNAGVEFCRVAKDALFKAGDFVRTTRGQAITWSTRPVD